MNSPFGGKIDEIKKLHVDEVIGKYRAKCNANVRNYFNGIEYIRLFRCALTGYRFWYPFHISGDDLFYEHISACWNKYYKKTRVEYEYALEYIKSNDYMLEVGAGKGHFLSLAEKVSPNCTGLEINKDATKNKVCKSAIKQDNLLDYNPNDMKYDIVCAFQFLEHMSEPNIFFEKTISILKENGIIIISVPNNEYVLHANFQDALDMPPHHMGQYDKYIFKEIAKLYNLDIIKSISFPRKFPSIDLSIYNSKNFFCKFYFNLINYFGNKIFNILNEPGHTIFVVMRKNL
jgi:SAM-dependent methyltransferase